MDTQKPPPLPDDAAPNSRAALWAMARYVFVRWEIMRIAFIVILTVESVWLITQIDGLFEVYPPPMFAALAVFAAIGANVAYFLGPIAEVYVRWLGFNQPIVRYVLWSLGTLFSMVVVFGVMVQVAILVEQQLQLNATLEKPASMVDPPATFDRGFTQDS